MMIKFWLTVQRIFDKKLSTFQAVTVLNYIDELIMQNNSDIILYEYMLLIQWEKTLLIIEKESN